MQKSLRHQSLLAWVEVTLALFLFSFLGAHAQEMHVMPSNAPDAGFVAPKRKTQKVQRKIEREEPIEMGGILTQAVRSKKPLELINPLAPASYGNGDDNVSQDPNELGKPQGLIIFGIQW
ncbi:MAG TPA: hypothetical protein VJK54_01005 [Chthoniobacterales bacterium]|nr:hypothetical protein [Chthoniobacterales bacterium]